MKNKNLPESRIINAGGHKYITLDIFDLIPKTLESSGAYEEAVHTISDRLIESSKPGIILDIGSNIGTYTIPLAKKYDKHLFICFEPQRIIYYQLCGNIILNSLYNVFTYNIALSNNNATESHPVPNYTVPNNLGAFSLSKDVRENNYECISSDNEYAEFVIKKLDLFNLREIRLIKIDVEGMELDVLQGAIETIKQNNYPPIIFEAWQNKNWYKDKRNELYNYLKDVGYKIQQFGENNLAQHSSREQFNIIISN